MPQSKKTCGAQTTRGRGPCRMAAGQGTDHPGYGRCKHHNGNTEPGIIRAGELMVRDEMTRNGIPVIDAQPEQLLLDEVHRAAGFVAWMQHWMNEHARASVALGESAIETLTRFSETGFKEAAFARMYRYEREHLAKVAKMAIDAGIAERQVQLAEQQGALVAHAIERILDQLGLTAEQKRQAPKIVRTQLLSLAQQETPDVAA